ncbi:MAG: HAD family phosphatase [Thermoanaerobaculia bacterium]|nr:HAD family phosphatase [Thermoanaerobaculia bacterium]
MIQGFIFDMDGTMVDNMMVHHRAWQLKLAENGLELTLEEVKASIHGINEEIIERLFGERFGPEDRRRIAWEKEAAYRDIFLPDLKLIEGLDNFLRAAHRLGIPMGIGTAAPRENVDFVLDNLGLRPLFRAVFDAKMVDKGKPDPEVFLKVAERLELKPENCLVFEDSPTGAEASRRAGMASVIVTTTHAPEEFARFDNVLRIISDFSALRPEDFMV